MAHNIASARGLSESNLAIRISECNTNYDIIRLVREFAKSHRFDYFMIGRVPDAGERKLAAVSIVSNWPTELVAAYDELGFMTKSPVVKSLRKSTKPVVWRASCADPQSPDYPGDEYYALFERFGVTMGIIIPVQQASGQRGAVTLSGKREIPSESELMELSYYANLLFARIAEIGNSGQDQDQMLTTRERECLHWTASGKTSQEIATILDLSEHTVNHYLSAACQKLNAANRAHAVAKAIRSGLLD